MTVPDSVKRFTSSTRRARLRARAVWAFVLAGIGFSASLVGLVQYARSGAVAIRPGRDPFVGGAAIEVLLAALFVSTGLLLYGMILR